jgi:glycosyltransferase involved in cell wall biosynthesis
VSNLNNSNFFHILIIPGENLNNKDQLSSIFEIHQADALKKMNLNVGFISTNLTGSIYTKFIQGIKNLDLNFVFSIQTKVQHVNDLNLVEANGVFKTPSFLNLYQKEKVNAGFIAFKRYLKEFGKPAIIHAHSRFLDSILIAQKIKEQFRIPYIVTEHSTFHQRNLVTKKDYIKYVSGVNDSSGWIVVSDSLGKKITSNLTSLNIKANKKYSVIPNVVDPSFKYSAKAENKKFIFLNIGSLDEKKNHSLLLNSFKIISQKYSDVELRIGGQGVLEKNLKNKVKELGLQKVKFLGPLNREQVKEEIEHSNAFVLSSIVETFGVVIIESLAIGRPVVSTICGGPEFILNHSNGILTESDDKYKLATAMCKMIDNYSNYNLKAISKNCIENYGPKVIGNKLIEIYKVALT